METPQLPKPLPLVFSCFRNIATIKTSQDLFDDVVSDPAHLPIVQTWADEASGIDHGQDQKYRTFQYAEQAIPPTDDVPLVPFSDAWLPTRFSDNRTYGVWYGAMERETSIDEALCWNYRHLYKPMLGRAARPVIVDRRMLIADCAAENTVDLRPLVQKFPDLVHDTDYSFCQALGAEAVKTGIDLFFTPSARRQGGTCVPIFNAKAIKEARAFGYLHFEFSLDGQVRVTTDQDEIRQIPDNW